jgi:hypothetical protein
MREVQVRVLRGAHGSALATTSASDSQLDVTRKVKTHLSVKPTNHQLIAWPSFNVPNNFHALQTAFRWLSGAVRFGKAAAQNGTTWGRVGTAQDLRPSSVAPLRARTCSAGMHSLA